VEKLANNKDISMSIEFGFKITNHPQGFIFLWLPFLLIVFFLLIKRPQHNIQHVNGFKITLKGTKSNCNQKKIQTLPWDDRDEGKKRKYKKREKISKLNVPSDLA
jgi:hypothetical protein